jgi:hypothetical protein
MPSGTGFPFRRLLLVQEYGGDILTRLRTELDFLLLPHLIPFQVIKRKCMYPASFVLSTHTQDYSFRSFGTSAYILISLCVPSLFFSKRDSELPGTRVSAFPQVNSLHASWFVCLSEEFPLVFVFW